MKENTHKFHHFHCSKILFSCTIFLLFNLSTPQQPDNSHPQRHMLSYNGDSLSAEPWLEFENTRLENAYIALQAWKESILSDPNNLTLNWIGPDVCNYMGVFCWPAPDNPDERTVAAIDINHANIAGTLSRELGLLYDLAVFHINSNRFCGPIPQSLVNWKLLYELDLSNNRFAGKFPADPILQLSSLKYLDIRFNEFEGELPSGLFDKDFDAVFINDNRFSSALPENIGNSKMSVIVLANNQFEGCVPASLGNMGEMLNELLLMNNGFDSCFPTQIGKLKNLTVLDISYNEIKGRLPDSIGFIESLELVNLGHNMMAGKIGSKVCELPNLVNFAYDNNFFSVESTPCLELPKFDDRLNCFRERPEQRSSLECQRFYSRGLNCSSFNCDVPVSPPSVFSPPPPSPGNPLPQPAPPSLTPPGPDEISPSPMLPPMGHSPPSPCLTAAAPPPASDPPSIF